MIIYILVEYFSPGFFDEWFACSFDQLLCCLRQWLFDMGFSHGSNVGKSHTVCREYSCKRVEKNPFHAKGISNKTGMLAAGTAKAVKSVLSDIITPLYGNLFDGICHILNRYFQKTFCNLLRGLDGTVCCPRDFFCKLHKIAVDSFIIQRLIGVGTKEFREVVRLNLAEHYIAICYGQGTIAAIA